MTDTSTEAVCLACPKCRCPLGPGGQSLHCSRCDRTYPVVDGIPDFITGDSQSGPVRHIAKFMDMIAPIYESRFWQQLNLRLAGARTSSLDTIADFHSRTLAGVAGSVLDVACGPATYGRRLATPSRRVWGVDISMGILRKGLAYIARDRGSGVQLARARVEELPFEDGVFGGAICSGSLHLFPDTLGSLREIARTMKAGAPLSVQTFVAGDTIVNRLLKNRAWVRSFELPRLQHDLTEAGFVDFQATRDGPIVLLFGARKAR